MPCGAHRRVWVRWAVSDYKLSQLRHTVGKEGKGRRGGTANPLSEFVVNDAPQQSRNVLQLSAVIFSIHISSIYYCYS